MLPRILLVNPPIYDFSAYDFWLKPYGLLTIGGFLQNSASLDLFDFLDRLHTAVPNDKKLRSDQWHRGEFISETISKPAPLATIPRRYHRFGLSRRIFQNWLAEKNPFDFVLVQTTMTYWYLGVKEVIEDIRTFHLKVGEFFHLLIQIRSILEEIFPLRILFFLEIL